MEHFKLQLGCLLVVLYVSFIYFLEKKSYKIKKREPIFECLLIVGIFTIIFDGITAYTVNHLENIPPFLNGIFHLCFLCGLDSIVYLMFLYILEISREKPKSLKKRLILNLPFIANLAVVVIFMPQLEYRKGEISNYSMGISAYTCFIMVAVYLAASIAVVFSNLENLGRHKLLTISTYIAVIACIAGLQMTFPQALITCIVPTVAIVGAYLNMENPVFEKLQAHSQEMVMGFATLVENRDDNTGGHIKRTTEYVRILSEELKSRGLYEKTLTRDYMKNLVMAAPMHDVGKIAIPDSILQKPGKLNDQEYEIMKTHAERGGKIIKETFGNTGDDEYEKMAYEVARHHHEKWNGKGYPDKLSKEQIPLCARIMAVADVFDAVSAKRCYRDALPIEECFKIIEKGRGEDFDPIIADIFLNSKEKILVIYQKELQG